MQWKQSSYRVHYQRTTSLYGVLLSLWNLLEMASFLEDHLMPNGSEESFICTTTRGCTEAHGAGFRVLQVCWAIVKGPRVSDWSDDEAGPGTDRATLPVPRGLPYGVNERLQEGKNMRNQQAHHALMSDMVEEVWDTQSSFKLYLF